MKLINLEEKKNLNLLSRFNLSDFISITERRVTSGKEPSLLSSIGEVNKARERTKNCAGDSRLKWSRHKRKIKISTVLQLKRLI